MRPKIRLGHLGRAGALLGVLALCGCAETPPRGAREMPVEPTSDAEADLRPDVSNPIKIETH